MEHDNDIKCNGQSFTGSFNSILGTEHPHSSNGGRSKNNAHTNAHNSSNQKKKYNNLHNNNDNDNEIKKEDKKPTKQKHGKKKNKCVKSLYIISRKLTSEITNMTITSIDADGIYTFMIDTLRLLSVNNGIYQLQNGDRIVNFGFRHKITNEVLYGYAKKVDPAINRSYEWSFDVILYTTANIKDKYGINDKQLPKSLILNDFNIPKLMNKDIKPLIDNTKSWAKINVCNINNKDTNKRRLTLALTVEQFKKNLSKYFRLHGNDIADLIPILICDENKKYCIEYVWIMSIEPGFDIGISFKSLKGQFNCKTVTKIYVDKQILLRHHMLLELHECHCLDNKFSSNITCLQIGNVSESENKLKDIQQRNKKIKIENTYLKMQITNMEQELKQLSVLISTLAKDNIIQTPENKESEATLSQNATTQPNQDDELSPVLNNNNVSQPASIIPIMSLRSSSTSVPTSIYDNSAPITPSVVTPQFNQQYMTNGNILNISNLTIPYTMPIYYFPPPEYFNRQISRN